MATTNTLRKTSDDMILLEHLPFELDGGIASRARIGLSQLLVQSGGRTPVPVFAALAPRVMPS